MVVPVMHSRHEPHTVCLPPFIIRTAFVCQAFRFIVLALNIAPHPKEPTAVVLYLTAVPCPILFGNKICAS